MSFPAKSYIKVESKTNGDFTPKNNIVEIMLPSDLGMIDGNNTFLEANLRVARKGNEEVLLPTAFGYNFGRNHTLGSLIRSIQLVSSKYGIVENINDVNVYLHNLANYSMKKGADDIFTHTGNYVRQRTRVLDQFSKPKKLSELAFSGTDDSALEQESSCKLPLNKILGLFQTDFMNMSHLGDLTIRIEFEKTRTDGVIVACEGDLFTDNVYSNDCDDIALTTAGQKTLNVATGKNVPMVGTDLYVRYNNATDSKYITFFGRVQSVSGQEITLEKAIEDEDGNDVAGSKNLTDIEFVMLVPQHARVVEDGRATTQHTTATQRKQLVIHGVKNPADIGFSVGHRVYVRLQQNATEGNVKTTQPTETSTYIANIHTEFDSANTQLDMTITFTDNICVLNNYVGNAIISSSTADKVSNGGTGGTATAPENTNPLPDNEVSYNLQEVSIYTMVYDRSDSRMAGAKGKTPDTFNTIYSERLFITQLGASGERNAVFNAPQSITSSLVAYCPESSISTDKDGLEQFRIQVDNMLIEDRDTEVEKSLYRDAVIDGIVSSENPVYNVNDRINGEDGNAFIVATPLKFKNDFTKIDIHLEQSTTAGTSNKQLYNFYNQIKMYPK